MRKVFLVLLIIVLSTPLYAQGEGGHKYEEFYYKGNQNYKDGNYQDALDCYTKILNSGYVNGNLFYNMGNACYRLNLIGHAVLYYERALLLMPRDPDLKYNLNFVRKLTKDAVSSPSYTLSEILFWTGSMTINELFYIFIVVNFLFWCAVILRFFLKKEWTYYLPVILFVIWLLAGISWGWKYYLKSSDSRAVVLPEEVNILSGPDEREKLLFQLHAGTVVIQERSEDNWLLIRLGDRRGWVKKNSIQKIVM